MLSYNAQNSVRWAHTSLPKEPFRMTSEKSNDLLWSFGECLIETNKILQRNTEKASLQFISVTCNGSCFRALSSHKALWWLVLLWICCSSRSCNCSRSHRRSRSTTLQGCKGFLLAQGGLTKLHVLFVSQTDNYLVEIWLDEIIVNLSCPVRQST